MATTPQANTLTVRSEHPGWRRAAVLYHPRITESRALADELAKTLTERGADARVLDAWQDDAIDRHLAEVDWAVALGGDGTMLRLARIAAPHGVPLIGVNFGRLGFLAELDPEQALEIVPRILEGNAQLDERLMLRCTAWIGDRCLEGLDAVNDVFVGRGMMSRPVRLDTAIDGAPLARIFADGLVVATQTGSTAYSLSAGGPVVAPTVDAMVLTPVVPHPVPVSSLVLHRTARVDITVHTDYDGILSVDGQHCHSLADGDRLRVECSPLRARFLRLGPPNIFYSSLMERLQRGKTTPGSRRAFDG